MEFLKAIEESNLEEAISLYSSRRVDIHFQNDFAIILAAEKGDLNIFKFLVEKGSNLNTQDYAVLNAASDQDHLNIIKYIFEIVYLNDQPRIKKILMKIEYTPLVIAASNGNLPIFQYLLPFIDFNFGYNDNDNDDDGPESYDYAFLQDAIRNNHINIVEYFFHYNTLQNWLDQGMVSEEWAFYFFNNLYTLSNTQEMLNSLKNIYKNGSRNEEINEEISESIRRRQLAFEEASLDEWEPDSPVMKELEYTFVLEEDIEIFEDLGKRFFTIAQRNGCHDDVSLITGENYEANKKYTIYMLRNETTFFDKGNCGSINEFQDALRSDYNVSNPTYIMTIGTTPTLKDEMYTGLSSKPTQQIIVRVGFTNPIYITLGSAIKLVNNVYSEFFAIPLYNRNRRRVINLNGTYGESLNHSQIPGFIIYQLFTKLEIESGVNTDNLLNQYPIKSDNKNLLELLEKTKTPIKNYINTIINALL